jgi:hypothetical protein
MSTPVSHLSNIDLVLEAAFACAADWEIREEILSRTTMHNRTLYGFVDHIFAAFQVEMDRMFDGNQEEEKDI